ncbi:beta galactofuranosyl glycosyltransferase [Trypanosoma cruzi]|nr:beta galactofuranosyl glycosyltransferase [Trypanosoma cruzi]
MEGFVGALEPFCADGRPRTLSMRGHCAGRNLFFLHIDTEPFLRTFFFFFTFFCFLSGDAPLALPPTGYARSYTRLKNRGHEPFSERMLYLSSHIKFVVHFDLFFFGVEFLLGDDPTYGLVLIRPGRTISTASGKGLWWIQRHGGWGEIITGRTLSR